VGPFPIRGFTLRGKRGEKRLPPSRRKEASKGKVALGGGLISGLERGNELPKPRATFCSEREHLEGTRLFWGEGLGFVEVWLKIAASIRREGAGKKESTRLAELLHKKRGVNATHKGGTGPDRGGGGRRGIRQPLWKKKGHCASREVWLWGACSERRKERRGAGETVLV